MGQVYIYFFVYYCFMCAALLLYAGVLIVVYCVMLVYCLGVLDIYSYIIIKVGSAEFSPIFFFLCVYNNSL